MHSGTREAGVVECPECDIQQHPNSLTLLQVPGVVCWWEGGEGSTEVMVQPGKGFPRNTGLVLGQMQADANT